MYDIVQYIVLKIHAGNSNTTALFYILAPKCNSNPSCSLWIFLNCFLKPWKKKRKKNPLNLIKKKIVALLRAVASVLFWNIYALFKTRAWFPHRQNKEAGGWLTVEFIRLVNWVLIWPTIHLLQTLFKCKVILWSCFSFCFICVNIKPYELP